MTKNQKKILSLPLAIALFLLSFASIVKIQHWPFGLELVLVSLIAIGALYLIRYGLKKSKNIKDTAKVVMVLSSIGLGVFAPYKMNNLVYFQIILMVSGSAWLALEVWDIIRKKPKSERANIPQLMGMSLLIAHVVVMIMGWPFAVEMLMLSLFAPVLLAIGFLVDSGKQRR